MNLQLFVICDTGIWSCISYNIVSPTSFMCISQFLR